MAEKENAELEIDLENIRKTEKKDDDNDSVLAIADHQSRVSHIELDSQKSSKKERKLKLQHTTNDSKMSVGSNSTASTLQKVRESVASGDDVTTHSSQRSTRLSLQAAISRVSSINNEISPYINAYKMTLIINPTYIVQYLIAMIIGFGYLMLVYGVDKLLTGHCFKYPEATSLYALKIAALLCFRDLSLILPFGYVSFLVLRVGSGNIYIHPSFLAFF